MQTIILFIIITICYAAYNLLVKVSTTHVGSSTSPIIATICLQAAALSVSLVYLIFLARQNTSLVLPGRAYFWAVVAGLSIGIAEVLYFYLFRGFANASPVSTTSAIPFIVGGTVVIAVVVSHFVFRETLNIGQWLGVSLAFVGMIVLAVNSSQS